MFSKATANFVHQIDPDGSLIHVSGPNDSRKLTLMALVIRRNRIWFWQRPKYQPTHFTLSDLLLGNEELTPGVCETDFLTYEGTFGGRLFGRFDTHAGAVSLELEGRGTSELQSYFGKLKKEELDVKKLLRDSNNRLVNIRHRLVQQLKKRAEVLALVKERILTTNSCSVTQTRKEQCTFQGILGLMDMFGSTIKDRNKIEVDSNVSVEIPADTVIAYSVLELEVKSDGNFNLCLQPGTAGCFEADWSTLSSPPHESLTDMVDGKCNGKNTPPEAPEGGLAVQRKTDQQQQHGPEELDLSPLAELPASTRHVFFQKLREVMQDRTALSYLQCKLEELCNVETPNQEEPVKGQRSVSADLNHPSLDALGLTESHSPTAAQRNAAHLLVSAMEELPDETLNLLSKSSVDFLGAFNTLMCKLKESSRPLSVQCLPVLLQDIQAFQLAEQLLGSVAVTLKRNAESVWTEKRDEVLPLLLCLTTHGVTLLCHELK